MISYPTNWSKAKLSEIADVGWGDLSVTKKSYVETGYTAYSATGPDGFLPYFDYSENGIVVSAIGANCGKIWRANGKWSCIKNTMRIIMKESPVSIDYLYHFLSVPNVFPKRGSGQPFVSKEDARDMVIAYPPIGEQHQIVDLLEDHLSRLDAATEDVRQANLKSTQLRRSLLHAAFTGNLNFDGPNFVSKWQTKKVGELADTQLGKMLNKGKQTGENTIPYLRSLNVQWGRIDTSDLNKMDILPIEFEKFTVKKGDLLICEGGDSGRVAIWDREETMGFQNALHRVRVKPEISTKYLFYYFEWLVKNQLIKHLFNGVTIKHFPQENLRSVEVSYPTIGEQHKIVNFLEDHLSHIDATVALADAMEKQSYSFRRSLLQAAFTGQLTNEVSSV